MIDKDLGVIKYIYAYKNKVAGVFYQPFVMDDDPALAVKKLVRSVQIDNEASKNLRHLELWLLGQFEDNKGDIEAKKEYLLDIDEVIAQFLQVGKEDIK